MNRKEILQLILDMQIQKVFIDKFGNYHTAPSKKESLKDIQEMK